MLYLKPQPKTVYETALYNMGTTLLSIVADTTNGPALTLSKLPALSLSKREIEICSLHFIDGHPRKQIAEWLGVTTQYITQSIAHAAKKYPILRTLRKKLKRPRIIHFSQLTNRDRNNGPFNADEL